MIADKSINLDTLHKVLFDNEKLELSAFSIISSEAIPPVPANRFPNFM